MKDLSKNKKILIIILVVLVIIIGIIIWRVISNKTSIDPITGAEITSEGKRVDQSDDNVLEEIMNGGTMEEPKSYATATEYTENVNISDTEFTSNGFEENAVLVSDGVTATFSNITITRDAQDSNDETGAKMFGIGAALLAKNSVVSLLNSTITTSGKGATGAFSYGTGILLISNSSITTYGNNAGGIHTSSRWNCISQ